MATLNQDLSPVDYFISFLSLSFITPRPNLLHLFNIRQIFLANRFQNVVEIIAVLLTILAFVYWRLSERNKYWKERMVVHRRPLLFYGNVKDRLTFKTPYHLFYRQFYEDFKDHKYVGVYEGRIPSLMIRDPDLIRNILAKDFDHFVDRSPSRFKPNPQIQFMLLFVTGNQWKQLRAAVTPTFTSGKMRGMCSTVEDNAVKMVEYLKKKIAKTADQTLEGVDTKDLFGKVALDIIASTAFGVQCDSFKEDGKSEFAEKISLFNKLSGPARVLLLSLLLLDLPTWMTKRMTLSFFNSKTVDFLAQVYKDTAKYRADNKIRRNDFLQLLLDAQEGLMNDESALEQIHKDALINEDVAIAQSVLFFIAGYETSSSLLSMASYCLAQEKEVQDKLRNEIINVWGDDVTLSYDKINQMNYLDMVLSETLRLFPPVARLDRVCSKPYKIDHIEIPVGGRVFIPCGGIHMDPAYYPEPEKFVPERFSAEEKAKRHPYVYMPFGLGPRNCIGMRFAQMSTKIVMAHLIKNFIIEIDSETPLPFQYDTRSMLLKPKDGILKVKLRAASY